MYVARVRQAALTLLLPTGREALSNVIKTLTASVVATVQLQRTVAGLTAATRREDEIAKKRVAGAGP